MYNKFFGLAEAPFNITPDSRFLFLSKRHREAWGALVYGIRERKGFILLTGEIGSGKTTVCRALIHELKADNIRLAVILNPGLSEMELLRAINDEFGIRSDFDTKKGLIDCLNQFLIERSQNRENVVLIIDEAQNLEPDLLEQIRMLSNLETEDAKLIQIVLMGQPELNETLALSQLEQLNQRIAVRYHIGPLSEEEMQAYIRHRLFIARAKIEVEFTPGAIRMAYAATRGIPRRINVLMDRALLSCYVDGSYTVDERIMTKAVHEIAGELPKPPEKETGSFAQKVVDNIFTKKIAITIFTLLSTLALVVVAILVGIQLANMKAEREVAAPAQETELAQLPVPGADENATSGTELTKNASGSTATAEATPTPAPTPAPDYEEIRRRNPNWKYEKNAPLVRVNNPRLAYRAAQLSLLKSWGIAVDLSGMSALSERKIIESDLTWQGKPIPNVPIKGNYYEAIRFDVPLIVRLSNPAENESEYIVILQAQGNTVTVGDPVWGIKLYKAADLMAKWADAQTLLIDHHQLASLKKGDRNEKVRAMQLMLKEFLGDKDQKQSVEVNGLFDVKTTDAISRFQSYYSVPATGQLDNITLLLLNSRMMVKGPRLRIAEVN